MFRFARALRTSPLVSVRNGHIQRLPETAPWRGAAARLLSSGAAGEAKEGEQAKFLGANCTYTSKMEFEKSWPSMKCFRRLDNMGRAVEADYTIKLDNEKLLKIYRTMVQLNVMDQIFYDAQRQGRISFYMTHFGEEAAVVGSAAALDPQDWVFGQYREAGVLMWRGFGLEAFANQCFSNALDLGKGRQMPVHYGTKDLYFQTISSPLATQLPQAAGVAYAMKREQNGKVVICYFGDGAASEGDFHVALNMSSTLSCPVIFFVRNNGYAISTPTKEQYRGDGIASRGQGYGMATLRVDGNDLLAVHEATTEARRIALEENRPVLIEAMTYRGGHHSTSDDSSRYRDIEEIQYWQDNNNPLNRTRLLLEHQGIWDAEHEAALRQQARKDVLFHIAKAEQIKRPAISQLFADVYDKMPANLHEQNQQLHEHLQKYGDNYLGDYQTEEEYVSPDK